MKYTKQIIAIFLFPVLPEWAACADESKIHRPHCSQAQDWFNPGDLKPE